MQNLFRRPSGVWVARLAVPARLRQTLGRREFIQSTRTTDPAIGKLISSALLAGWRRTLYNADRSVGQVQMEDEVLLRVVDGAPALVGATHLPLQEAAHASGITAPDLLRQVAEGALRLYVRLVNAPGFVLSYSELTVDDAELGTRIVPLPESMPAGARREMASGVWALMACDAQYVANHWLHDPATALVLHLLDGGRPGLVFVHDEAPELLLSAVEVAAGDVDRLRAAKAAGISATAVEAARARVTARLAPESAVAGLRNGSRPLRESIDTFLLDAGRPRGREQQERLRRACEIFLALMGSDLTGGDLHRDLLLKFRDEALPTFPAEEAKLRLQHKTTSYAESVARARDIGWPRMSAAQRVKHFGWLCDWVVWLGQGGWAGRDISDGLARRGAAAMEVRKASSEKTDADRRDPFTRAELAAIFGADWFKAGRGELTSEGKHYGWSPYKTFVPLVGLLTGARINEICQLSLSDFQEVAPGLWVFAITKSDLDDADEFDTPDEPKSVGKRLKNANARRIVPVHSELIRLGLIEYRAALVAAGYKRLFPELKLDENKGYGKAATKWFSGYLKKLQMPRNGRKVFHSFRHNVATTLQNELDGRLVAVKQLLGHSRGKDVTDAAYRKDMETTGRESELVRLIEGLHHDFLQELKPLDIEAGVQAVSDALRRKNKGRGADED